MITERMVGQIGSYDSSVRRLFLSDGIELMQSLDKVMLVDRIMRR